MNLATIEKAFAVGKERYEELGVDVEAALETMSSLTLSLPCWQGDDVRGFEKIKELAFSGGIQATGSYPGRARTADELRRDLKKALALIPGNHRVNLHASYGEFGHKAVSRDEIEPAHFHGWLSWAKEESVKLDFNATCFAHPKADTGFTLSSPDKGIRRFWIEHVKRCRKIAGFLGRELKTVCIHNIWIPDGSKDEPFDRWTPRGLLRESLDEIFQTEYSPSLMKDSLESKLFGLGSEAYVVGSHEFYSGYALSRRKMVCLDLGHFHPTESVADKLSALLQFFGELVLHLSRPVRWDSDHVVILDDELKRVAAEVVRGRALEKTHLALDFFDASMNRIGALAVGARATLKAFLPALLEPEKRLREAEADGDHFRRLALFEEVKTLPFGALWDYHCLRQGVPTDRELPDLVKDYERTVLNKR
ncbi:MAG TPA: L-rhamnose isomerase [Candidatus Desulfaltia sp.]|nr:L-rhamnose isomerase [Candidatus Desulfaltia sp.]